MATKKKQAKRRRAKKSERAQAPSVVDRFDQAMAGNAKELLSMAGVIERLFGWLLQDGETIRVVVDGKEREMTLESAREVAAAMRAQAKRFS